MSNHVDIVFDGPPGPEAGRFVEVEDPTGASIRLGEWIERQDGTWVLRIPDPRMEGDHLTPEDVTGRGFKHMPKIPSEYGGYAKVYESSAASGPHIWIQVVCPANLNEPDGPMIDAVGHMTAENAHRIGEQLIWLADNHYQNG